MKYLTQRLVRTALLLVGVSILCFLFTEMAPGNFFDEMRLNPQISPETIAMLQARYGFDRPPAIRYFRWVGSMIHGDFGYSAAYQAPVAPLLWERAKNTLLLTSSATLLIWVVGLPLGVWTASRHGKLADRMIGGAASLLIAVPEIVIAVGLLALAVRTRAVPIGGMMSLDADELSFFGKLRDIGTHLLLPMSILVLVGVPIIQRHVRMSVLEVQQSPCIVAARGLGIGPTRVLFRHVLPLAANPAISLLGFSLAGLLGGSLLVEVMTGWPGLGPLILEATLSRDLYLVIGAVMLSALFMVMGNFVADVLLVACDSRIRAGEPDAA